MTPNFKVKKALLTNYFKKVEHEPNSRNAHSLPPPPPPPQPFSVDSNEYPSDPGLSKNIINYNVNKRDNIPRYYLQKSLLQLRNHEFPWHSCVKENHRFQAKWFDIYPHWLEYIIEKDAAFCLQCYLFKVDHGVQSGGDTFVTEGFKNWRKVMKLSDHVGEVELIKLKTQLDSFIFDMRSGDQFSEVVGISGLAKNMVQLKKHRVYPSVYLLLKLAMLLPVATATVERVFSAMKIVKTLLRNRLGDDMINDCLVPYIERDVSNILDNEDIIQHF